MLYIVPSRGRPNNIAVLLNSWEATRTTARLWVCVDEDDPELPGYKKLDIPVWASLRVGPRMRLGPTLNHYATKYIEQCNADGVTDEVIGFMGDDHRPRTKGWDAKINRSCTDMGMAVVYCNDLVHGSNLPTAVALTQNIVQTLGYMVPPDGVHLYFDNFWKHLGEELGCLRYLPGEIIEHCHPIVGKAAWDKRYEEVNSGELYDSDRKVFEAWKRNCSAVAFARLRSVMS